AAPDRPAERLASPRAFALEQCTLARNTPAIAGETAIAAHDAMARYRHRQRIRGARLGYRAHGPGPADAAGELGIAHARSGPDLAQRDPHLLLEQAAAKIERQFESVSRRLDPGDHARDPLLELPVRADQLRFREAPLQILHQRIRIVAERDGAYAALARGDENRAQPALAHGEVDRRAFAAGAIGARPHPERVAG